eukprot:tig00022099_g23812.t1
MPSSGRRKERDASPEAGSSGGGSKSLSQANALTIPLRPQEKPVDINYNNPEVLKVIQTEYVTRFLDSLGASASRANIELVRRHIPIEEAKKTAAYKSRGAITDSLYIAPGVVKSAALQVPASLQNAQARSLISKALLDRPGPFEEKPVRPALPRPPPPAHAPPPAAQAAPGAASAAAAAAAAAAVARTFRKKEEEEKAKPVEVPFEEVKRRYVFPFSLLAAPEARPFSRTPPLPASLAEGAAAGAQEATPWRRAALAPAPRREPRALPGRRRAPPAPAAASGSEGEGRGRSRSRSPAGRGAGTFGGAERFGRRGLRVEAELPPLVQQGALGRSEGARASRGRLRELEGSVAERIRRELDAEAAAGGEEEGFLAARAAALANIEREVVEELRAPYRPHEKELREVQRAFAKSFPWHLLLERLPRKEIFGVQEAVEGPELRRLMGTLVEFLYFAFLGRFRPRSPPPPPPEPERPPRSGHRRRAGSDARTAPTRSAPAAPAPRAAPGPPPSPTPTRPRRSSRRPAASARGGAAELEPEREEHAERGAERRGGAGGARSAQGSRAGSAAGSAASTQGPVVWEDVDAAKARLFGELHEQFAGLVEPLRGSGRPGREQEAAARLGLLFRLPVLLTCLRAAVSVLFERKYPKWFALGDGREAAARMDSAVLALLDPDRYLLHLSPLESSVQAMRILSAKQNVVHQPIARKIYSTSAVVRALFPHAPHVRDRRRRAEAPRDGSDVAASIVAGRGGAAGAGPSLAEALDSLMTTETRDRLYGIVLERIHKRHAASPHRPPSPRSRPRPSPGRRLPRPARGGAARAAGVERGAGAPSAALAHAQAAGAGAADGSGLGPAGPGQPFNMEVVRLNLRRVLEQQAAAVELD